MDDEQGAGTMFDSVYFLPAVLLYAALWFYLSHQLFRALAERHPKIFEAMGKPEVFKGRSTWPLLRYLFSRDYEQMDDPQVVWMSRTLLILYVGTNAAFLVYIAFYFGWLKWG
jgi:hypothetical protein